MIGWIVLALVALAVIASIAIYNRLVNYRNDAKNAFAQIDVQLTRRYDLIPNLVEVARKYLQHEQETLTAVIAARDHAANALKNTAGSGTNVGALAAAEQALGARLGGLYATFENYPDLKASDNFEPLQTQLEGTEHRITPARNRYIEHVRDYNSRIRTFPTSLIARLSGLHAKANFEAENEAVATAPQVSFP